MRSRLLIALRAILLGWATLLLITMFLERPLLNWTRPILGIQWIATAKLALHCLTLAATGWIVGRLNRPAPLLAVTVFAATLAFRDLTPLFRLLVDTFRDTRYLDSLGTTAASQLFLFGSLFAGGLLSRPKSTPVSIL